MKQPLQYCSLNILENSPSLDNAKAEVKAANFVETNQDTILKTSADINNWGQVEVEGDNASDNEMEDIEGIDGIEDIEEFSGGNFNICYVISGLLIIALLIAVWCQFNKTA